MRAHIRVAGPILLALFALSGCNNDGLSTQGVGYLANDPCTQITTEGGCGLAPSCRWVQVEIPVADGTIGSPNCGPTQPVKEPAPDDGVETSPTPRPQCDPLPAKPPLSGVCVTVDACQALSQSDCQADANCAWSGVRKLCPAGADCEAGGYCHRRNDDGTDCACVSPVACPFGAECPPVECDCSGGGSSGGSGGACTCACAPCAPGESCPPCDCNCGDGGSGCVEPGTCVTMCPNCISGESCECTTICDGGPAPDGTTSPGGTPSSGPTAPPQEPCACDCPPCAPGAVCEECVCDCGGNGGGYKGCVPPPVPNPTQPAPIACPEIGCANDCSNGYKTAANGCPSCECL